MDMSGKRTDYISWDEYFMDLANAAAKRATCDRGRSGCVIVKDKQVLVTGYVGAPKGLPHCDDVGHLFKQMINEDGSISNHCVRTVHAEQNAIIQAAKLGVSLEGATMYVTHQPCVICTRMIINSGVKRVVYKNGYPDEFALQLFAQSDVELIKYSDLK